MPGNAIWGCRTTVGVYKAMKCVVHIQAKRERAEVEAVEEQEVSARAGEEARERLQQWQLPQRQPNLPALLQRQQQQQRDRCKSSLPGEVAGVLTGVPVAGVTRRLAVAGVVQARLSAVEQNQLVLHHFPLPVWHLQRLQLPQTVQQPMLGLLRRQRPSAQTQFLCSSSLQLLQHQ